MSLLLTEPGYITTEDALRFRWCQTDDFLRLVEILTERESVGVPYATGGGKTILSLAVGIQLIRNAIFDRVLILTPSTVIAKQFKRQACRWVLPTHDEFEPFQIGSIDLISDGAALSRAFTPLADNDKRARILVTTHQMFTTNFVTGSDFTRYLLADRRTWIVIDEAQHCPWSDADPIEADSEQDRKQLHALGRGISQLRRDGFVTGKFSGTATRTDGLPVFADSDNTEVGRSLHQLMIYGMAPQTIRTEVVHVDGLSESDTDSTWIPIEPDKGARAVHAIWAKYDYVPACVRVKPRNTEANRAAIDALQAVIGKDRVIDASGEFVPAFDEALEREDKAIKTRTASYPDYQTMFVGMTRIVTGVDSPSRALAVLYGIPRSINVLLQFLGRELRLKIDYDTKLPLIMDFPAEWLDRVQLVFLVGGDPNEDARREEHFGVLYQALALTESLNYAAMFGKLFRQIYDGMRKDRHGDPKPVIEGEFLRLVTSNSPQLLAEAELDFESMASPLDSLPYNGHDIKGRLRLIRGWLQAKTRHEAKQEGLVDEAIIEAAVKAAVQKELPGIEALLGLRSASEPRNTERAQQILLQLADKSLQEQIQALFEEFKNDIPETTSGYLLDAKLIEHHRLKAGLVLGKAKPLPSIAEILKRVSAFQERNHGAFPSLDDRDPLNPSVTFATYDKHLRTRCYPEFAGELGELLIQREPTPWWQDARDIDERFNDPLYHPRGLPLGLLQAWNGKSRIQRLQEMFRDRSVVCYYPRAVQVAGAKQGDGYICSTTFLQALTLPEAQRLGGRPRLNLLLAELQEVFTQGGIEAVRERL